MLKVIILTLCASLALANVQQQALRSQLSQKPVVAEAPVVDAVVAEELTTKDEASVVNPAAATDAAAQDAPHCLQSCTLTDEPTCDEILKVNAGCGIGCPQHMKDLMHDEACKAPAFLETQIKDETQEFLTHRPFNAKMKKRIKEYRRKVRANKRTQRKQYKNLYKESRAMKRDLKKVEKLFVPSRKVFYELTKWTKSRNPLFVQKFVKNPSPSSWNPSRYIKNPLWRGQPQYIPKLRRIIPSYPKKEIEENKEYKTLRAKIKSIKKKDEKIMKAKISKMSAQIWSKFDEKVKNGSKKLYKDRRDLNIKISKNSRERRDLTKAYKKNKKNNQKKMREEINIFRKGK